MCSLSPMWDCAVETRTFFYSSCTLKLGLTQMEPAAWQKSKYPIYCFKKHMIRTCAFSERCVEAVRKFSFFLMTTISKYINQHKYVSGQEKKKTQCACS